MQKQIVFHLLIIFTLSLSPSLSFRIFGFDLSSVPAEEPQPVNRSNRPPPPVAKKSENSWLYDLLYGRKKPQYYEPQQRPYQRVQEVYQPSVQQQQQFQSQYLQIETSTFKTPIEEVVTERRRSDPKPPPPEEDNTFVKPVSQSVSVVEKSPDYQEIEIITAPPPSHKAYGQSFEVKVGAGFGTKS